MTCHFCQSQNLKLQYTNKFHSIKKNHGPVNFYICKNCGSGLTYPLLSTKSLKDLYASFDGGMSVFTRMLREKYPLHLWYNQCVDRSISLSGKKLNRDSTFDWIDIGAGNGEVSKILSLKYPHSKGVAVDFHDRPADMEIYKNVRWIKQDLNETSFLRNDFNGNFDLAISITVLEHVINPADFLKSTFNLLKKEGTLYLTSPDIGSIASKCLGPFWPYLIWGEHLNIPTKKGLAILLQSFNSKNRIMANPVTLKYPINYYLDNFHLRLLTRLFRNDLTINLNTGIMEGVLTRNY